MTVTHNLGSESNIDLEECIRSSSIILELAIEAIRHRISNLSVDETNSLISSLDEIVKITNLMKGTLLSRLPYDNEIEVNLGVVAKYDVKEGKDETYTSTSPMSHLHEQIVVSHKTELDAAPNQ